LGLLLGIIKEADMDQAILIFLGVALAILVLAFFLPRWFRKSIARDKRHEDLNADHHDGRGTATWIGINKSGGGPEHL